MKAKERLTHLQEQHDLLDAELVDMFKRYDNNDSIVRLKKKKLEVKDQITALKKELTLPNRRSIIKVIPAAGLGTQSSSGPDTVHVIELYENDHLVEKKSLPGKGRQYVNSIAEDWELGFITLEDNNE